MTDLEILTAAQEVIRDPKNWTQNYYSRDHNNQPVHVSDTSASCFCTAGAVAKVLGFHSGASVDGHHVLSYLSTAIQELFEFSGMLVGSTVYNFNDMPDRDHTEIMAVFDRARELAA